MADKKYTFVVEHLDPELGPWSALEYKTTAKESQQSGCHFVLSSVPQSLLETQELADLADLGAEARTDSIETYFASIKEKICLLDPSAKQELEPADAGKFNVFLFGGILGDDPPRDRTSELRKKGFIGRRLGPVQMTTDTAVRVTRKVILDQGINALLQLKTGRYTDVLIVPVDKIPYIDFPELKLDEHESTEMPFRYVVDETGKPIMPEGMLELIKADADKAFDNLEFADEVDGLDDLNISKP